MNEIKKEKKEHKKDAWKTTKNNYQERSKKKEKK